MQECIIYARVSSISQNVDGEKYSLDMQIKICKEYIKNNIQSKTSTTIISEVKSIYNNNSKFMDEILNKKNKFIMVYSFCRFSRSSCMGISNIKKLINNGNTLFVVIENIKINKDNIEKYYDILEKNFKANENESKRLSTRIKNTKKYLKCKGYFSGGVVPYGFRKENKKLIYDKHEQNIIKLINTCKNTKISKNNLKLLIKKIKKEEDSDKEQDNDKEEDSDKEEDIDKEQDSDNYKTMTFNDILELLLKNNIKKRDSLWEIHNIKYLYNKHNNINEINKVFDKINISTGNNKKRKQNVFTDFSEKNKKIKEE